jgi:hypothetical protein
MGLAILEMTENAAVELVQLWETNNTTRPQRWLLELQPHFLMSHGFEMLLRIGGLVNRNFAKAF